MALTMCKVNNSLTEESCETILFTAKDLPDTPTALNLLRQHMNIELLDNVPSLLIKVSHLYPCMDINIESEVPLNWFDSYPDIVTQTVYDQEPVPLQSYSCDKCSYVCKSRSRLNEHLKVHSESRPYTCETCPSSFERLTHLKRHKKFCTCGSTPAPLQPYSCKTCPGLFTRVENLKRHKKICQGICDAPNVKPYRCNICGASFRTERYVKEHQKRIRCSSHITTFDAAAQQLWTTQPWTTIIT